MWSDGVGQYFSIFQVFLKNTNKDIVMTKLNVYGSKYLISINIYLPLQIANKEKK